MKLVINQDTGQFMVQIDQSLVQRLGWQQNDEIQYQQDDEVLTLFKI